MCYSDEWGDSNILSKRRKPADSPAGMRALSSHNGRSRHSPSISKESESGSSAIGNILGSTVRTPPAAFDSPPLAAFPQVIDANQEWEARKIIDKEDVAGCRTTWWN